MSDRSTRDRGSNAVETAIVFPPMLLAVILFFQFGMIAYAHHVVANAAQAAASAAAAGGSGPDLLGSIDAITTGSGVSVGGDDEIMRAEGYATVMSILPFIPEVTVRAAGTATVERFRPEAER